MTFEEARILVGRARDDYEHKLKAVEGAVRRGTIAPGEKFHLKMLAWAPRPDTPLALHVEVPGPVATQGPALPSATPIEAPKIAGLTGPRPASPPRYQGDAAAVSEGEDL